MYSILGRVQHTMLSLFTMHPASDVHALDILHISDGWLQSDGAHIYQPKSNDYSSKYNNRKWHNETKNSNENKPPGDLRV